MLRDAMPRRSRPCMLAPNTQTQKGSDKRSGATWAALPTLRALTCGSIEANHLFLASDITKGRSIT